VVFPQNFECVDLWGAALAGEADVQASIAGWGYIAKTRSSAMFSPIASELISNPVKTIFPLILTVNVRLLLFVRSEVTK